MYAEKNRAKIAEKSKVKIHCEVCQCDVQKSKLSRHNLTIKHLEMNKKNVVKNNYMLIFI